MRKILGKYIKDIIYGANDGIITTFAIVAGAAGASLSTTVILILGFSNLVADGFSMAASNYLGNRSEKEMAELDGEEYSKSILKPAVFTFFSFVIAGAIPILPFVFMEHAGFGIAILATAFALFTVGASLGGLILKRHWFFWGIEMLVIGGVAASMAYGIGYWIGRIIGV